MKRARALLAGWLVAASFAACDKTPPPVSLPVTPPAEIPISGAAVPGMESYDQTITEFMRKFAIPGGAVAVMRDGKLIYARGFGYADVEAKAPVQPNALLRIASVSKPITAAAIMTLMEEGKLHLDDRVAPLIAHLTPAPGATVDPRWEQITIRHLLNHAGGWDRTKPNGGFDPIDRPAIAAAAVNAPAPASGETLIRYMKGMPLDFNPGERFAYSNFGYIILGRVIERVSGMRYEEYVRARVLQPVGATRTRQGRSRMSDAHPEEVKYYSPLDPGLGMTAPLVPSVFPGEGTVPINYGGFHLEVSDASGAWVSSTVDLLRFLAGVDGRATRPDILSAGLVAEMTSTGPTVCASGACFYGLGWFVRPTHGDANWWHGGSLPGTTAMRVRSYDNVSMVGLFNARSLTPNSEPALEAALWSALAGVTSIPTHDLFSTFQ
ncbi:MAG TPA: serine hydrolase domain-containing protein [Longimicrobium sp.]|jgi:N-acyl-D-amino-acid deacylase|uniref:serine hydrolase domain-containing protein n=1 Tax=Longimicrobium sp. TaxID=2029185 RepID=UPI002ED8A8B6